MDGTVVNTGVMIAKTINHVRSHLGLPQMQRDHLLHQVNNPDINPAEYFYGTEYFTDEQTKIFEEYYHENCIVGVELYDGIKELLDECSRDYTLTIATNAHTDFANRILDHLGVHSNFDMIIGADKVKNSKPDPEMIVKTIKNYNYSKEHAILVGDSHKDKRAAQSAGIKHLLVDWGFTQYEDGEKVIKDIKTLRDELRMF
jgi:phosphoglycolate phosphatase